MVDLQKRTLGGIIFAGWHFALTTSKFSGNLKFNAPKGARMFFTRDNFSSTAAFLGRPFPAPRPPRGSEMERGCVPQGHLENSPAFERRVSDGITNESRRDG
jgi:hypothetical protein